MHSCGTYVLKSEFEPDACARACMHVYLCVREWVNICARLANMYDTKCAYMYMCTFVCRVRGGGEYSFVCMFICARARACVCSCVYA